MLESIPPVWIEVLVVFGTLAIPFLGAAFWVLYRIVRGNRYRQQEILHTNIAILNTNQAILTAILRATPAPKKKPRKGRGQLTGDGEGPGEKVTELKESS